jgi:hypothetical protein
MPNRRFPPPWSVEDIGAAFVVRDANRQALGYFSILRKGRVIGWRQNANLRFIGVR